MLAEDSGENATAWLPEDHCDNVVKDLSRLQSDCRDSDLVPHLNHNADQVGLLPLRQA